MHTADSTVFSSVQKATFREQVVKELRQAIVNGVLQQGSQITEQSLCQQFKVSRGPLREALRELIDEGLLVTVPYTGTRVITLTPDDVREIHSLRVNLEIFAFKMVWEHRDQTFANDLIMRNQCLTQCIDQGDDMASIEAELGLHSLVYEASGHSLLQRAWDSIRGRLQLYWAAHHRAHDMQGPKRDGHDSYIRCALGDDFSAMCDEIKSHMARGLEQTEVFLRHSSAGRAADMAD